MELEDKYNKLEDFIDSLDLIADDLIDEEELKDYYYGCLELINQAEKEKDEIGSRLQKIYELEERELENQYWRDVV